MQTPHPIIPREKLDFGLDGDIPKYWFGGDAFKTRFFDAMSTLFPEGERFFISCVRDYRDQVTDPQMAEDIKHFIRQEGQHGMVHSRYNDRLKEQGIDVDKYEGLVRFWLFKIARGYAPKAQTLAETAATEHLTAIMADGMFTSPEVIGCADHRMRAMYAWHAIEEIEHKGVAFDVMQKVAKVGYARRVVALVNVTFGFNLYSLLVTSMMLKTDGFSWWQRAKIMTKGVWWLMKPGGVYASMLSDYFAYFRPSFHPWDDGEPQSYMTWRGIFDRTADPLEAAESLFPKAAV